MSDLDRWAKGEGPEPEGVRELLDAAQGVPNLTPEQRRRMRAQVRAAIDEDDRAWARRRTVTRVGAGAVAALALAAGVVLVVRFTRAPEPIADTPAVGSGSPRARELPMMQSPEDHPPAPDAGPTRRPRRR